MPAKTKPTILVKRQAYELLSQGKNPQPLKEAFLNIYWQIARFKEKDNPIDLRPAIVAELLKGTKNLGCVSYLLPTPPEKKKGRKKKATYKESYFGDSEVFELAAALVCLDKKGAILEDQKIVCRKTPKNPSASIQYRIRLSGKVSEKQKVILDGNEYIRFRFSLLPKKVDRILIILAIDRAKERGQQFDYIQRWGIKIHLTKEQPELVSYSLAGHLQRQETALVLGELRWRKDHWQLLATGEGINLESESPPSVPNDLNEAIAILHQNLRHKQDKMEKIN